MNRRSSIAGNSEFSGASVLGWRPANARRQKISARCVDAAVYQAAYDAEPELKHILDALWLERGWAQKDRDEKAYKAAMSQRVRNPRAKRCPTRKRAT